MFWSETGSRAIPLISWLIEMCLCFKIIAFILNTGPRLKYITLQEEGLVVFKTTIVAY